MSQVLAHWGEVVWIRQPTAQGQCFQIQGPTHVLGPHIDAIVGAHDAIADIEDTWESDGVMRVTETIADDDLVKVRFDRDVVALLPAFTAWLRSSHQRMPYRLAFTFADILVTTVERMHRASPPVCLGALAWENVGLTADGGVVVLGLGHNPSATLDASGTERVVALEVQLGSAPTPQSDIYHVFTTLQRLASEFTNVPDLPLAALRGQPLDTDPSLGAEVVAFAASVLAGHPSQRATSMTPVAAQFRSMHRRIGVEADMDALRAYLGEFVSQIDGHERVTIQIAPGSTHVDIERSASATRVDLGRKRVIRAVCACLVDAWFRGQRCSLEDLQAAGWPDEQMAWESGRNRAYVAVSTLRKLLGDDVLDRDDEGYGFAAGVVIERVRDADLGD